MKTDPHEMKDVYANPDYAAVRKELHEELAKLRKDLKVPDPDPASTRIQSPKKKKK